MIFRDRQPPGISLKIMCAMLVTAIIPIALSWYIHQQEMIRQISLQVEHQLTGVSNNLSAFVNNWVEMNRRMLAQNATLPPITSWEPARQKAVLQSIPTAYPWIYLAFTTDKFGKNISRSDNNPLKDYSDRAYVQQVMNGSALGQQVLIGKTSGVPALVLATPIKGADERMKGVLAVAMKTADISRRISNTRIGQTGYAYLINSSGKIIAHPFTGDGRQPVDLPVLKPHQNYFPLQTFTDKDGKKVIALVNQTDQGWQLVVRQDYAEAYKAVSHANSTGLIILICTLIVVPLVAYPLSLKLTSPIRRLTLAANEISQGALTHPITDVNRTDEIGALARAIERLKISVEYAMKKIHQMR